MCGICGLLALSPDAPDRGAATAGRMADTLAHRGPDASGVWADDAGTVALGHRRLSILDLSPLGAQPMHAASGRYTLSYNGEVYNFADLRADLERAGHRFRGHSDTEVLLAGFDAWGVEATVTRAIGMFAMAVWDAEARTLRLVRDRMGQKPLYVGWAGRTLVFGSELKALRAHPDFVPEVDRDALALYFQYTYVPGPHTIYRGVRMLPPGTIATLAPDRLTPGEPLAAYEAPYWTLDGAVEAGRQAPFRGTPAAATDALDALLTRVVGDRLVADVPVGAFLSGGVDSTAIVAAATAASPAPVRTFTIGFDDPAYDESGPAAAVAAHLGTDHTTLRATPQDALAVVPRLGAIYDEPFADSSQIPTLLVSHLARAHVTVALSGDGGDELFAGYNRHLHVPRLWGRLGRVPTGLRRGAGRALQSVSAETWDRAYGVAAPALPSRMRAILPGNKVHKLAGVLDAASPTDLYDRLTRHRSAAWPPVIGARAPAVLVDQPERWPRGLDAVQQMLYLDARTYLPDDILTKVDRASMDASLEARAPFMDHRLVEFAWSLPTDVKIRDGRTKWLLREVVRRRVPDALMDRPKAGFGIPVGDWLRGPLRPWAEALLDPARIRAEGYLDPETVADLWAAHLAGRSDSRYEVWTILMFQAWLDAAAL